MQLGSADLARHAELAERLCMMSTAYFDDTDYASVFCDDISSTKRYFCEVEGCNKSYSSRQNRHRHKGRDHPELCCNQNTKDTNEASANGTFSHEREAHLCRERELLVETFASYCDHLGEERASNVMKNSNVLKQHLVPLRGIMEAELAESLAGAEVSQMNLEKQFEELQSAMPAGSVEHVTAFQTVINLVKGADAESIGHLKRFAVLISSFTAHVAEHSEHVNVRIKRTRALKSVLDELSTRAPDKELVGAGVVHSERDARKTLHQGEERDNVMEMSKLVNSSRDNGGDCGGRGGNDGGGERGECAKRVCEERRREEWFLSAILSPEKMS